jgi:hypothetical protein
MRKSLPLIPSIACLILVTGCSVGPVEELEDPQVPQGPGVFSGEDGKITYSDFFGDKNKNNSLKRDKDGRLVYYTDYSNINLPAVDEESFRDFEEFKAWRRANDPRSPDFQEYQDWRAYQQYRRFKQKEAQQSQTSPATETR